jgi:hypothetical protein
MCRIKDVPLNLWRSESPQIGGLEEGHYTAVHIAFVGKVDRVLRKLEVVLASKEGVSSRVLNLGREVKIIELKLDPNKLVHGRMAVGKLLELSPTDTYVHTHSLKFPQGRVSQQVGSAYLLTWEYQY